MADRMTKVQRSRNMSKIKNRDTSIELMVRRYLYHHGYRYRKNVISLPGKPDIVLSKYQTAIFVNGCFFHHHYGCKLAYIPKSNTQFWERKFERNTDKDMKNEKELKELGYKVIVVWECELKECFEYRMKRLIEEIEDQEYE